MMQQFTGCIPGFLVPAPYRAALFSTLIIDPDTATITIKSKKTEWVGKSPEALGYANTTLLKNGEEIVPLIRKRTLKMPQAHQQ